MYARPLGIINAIVCRSKNVYKARLFALSIYNGGGKIPPAPQGRDAGTFNFQPTAHPRAVIHLKCTRPQLFEIYYISKKNINLCNKIKMLFENFYILKNLDKQKKKPQRFWLKRIDKCDCVYYSAARSSSVRLDAAAAALRPLFAPQYTTI